MIIIYVSGNSIELTSFMLNFLHLNKVPEVLQLDNEYLFEAASQALIFLKSRSFNAIGFHTSCIRRWRKFDCQGLSYLPRYVF